MYKVSKDSFMNNVEMPLTKLYKIKDKSVFVDTIIFGIILKKSKFKFKELK
jgi:hypothetical protein